METFPVLNRACVEQLQFSRQLHQMEQEVVFCRGLTDSLKRSMPKHRWTSDDISHDSHGYDIDRLARELFLLHDLDGDGLLGEDELVQINLTIAVLHHGDNADLVHVEDSYRAMFREQFSPEGHDARFTSRRKG